MTSAGPQYGATFSASSIYSASYPAYNAGDYNNSTFWAPSAAQYNSNGAYTGGLFTTAGVAGEWIQIQTSVAISLYSYNLIGYSPTQSPGAWTLLGSNDTATWAVLDAQNLVSTTQISANSGQGGSGQYSQFSLLGTVSTYQFFRLVITRSGIVAFSNLPAVTEFHVLGR